MTPSDLADREKGSESGQQRGLFAWANMAMRYGYDAADDMLSYSKTGHAASYGQVGIPELEWLFHIPNGGDRDKRTAGNLKAEGVKAGVWDCFLPVPKFTPVGILSDADDGLHVLYLGLWIEMKKPGRETELNGGLSDVQIKWGKALTDLGHRVRVCYSWQQGVAAIKEYLGNG